MNEFNKLVEKYKGQQTNISAGLRPSGVIHIGNMATIALAGLVAREIGSSSKVNLMICNLDRPSKTDWSIKDNGGYVRFFNTLPDKLDCHDSLLEHSMQKIQDYISSLEKVLEVDFNIRMFSDLQRKGEFREGLKRILDDKELIRSLDTRIRGDQVPVYPLCQCHTSDSYRAEYRDNTLHARCKNPDCDVDDFSMDIYDLSKDLAVHLFFLILRDKVVRPYADIHVYGGDYKIQNDGRGETIATKVDCVAKAASGPVSENLFGPYFMCVKGKKMGKSESNGITMDKLRDSLGENYAGRIVDFVKHIAQQGIERVDYSSTCSNFGLQ